MKKETQKSMRVFARQVATTLSTKEEKSVSGGVALGPIGPPPPGPFNAVCTGMPGNSTCFVPATGSTFAD
ncbi:MAG: hypothetical protein JKY60_09295 [Kordiimonadaceae bacterium]|nr:hypothetical protein [Kordiimonadaceae bacterium]